MVNSDEFRKRQSKNHAKPPLLDVLLGETDRGCALVAGEYIDDQLGEVLLFTISKSISNNADGSANGGVVRQFSVDLRAKSGLCLVLGLISVKLYESIQEMKNIRDFMAHFSGAGLLSDELVHDLTSKLAPELHPMRDLERESRRIFGIEPLHLTPRGQFIEACVCISIWLDGLWSKALTS